jgi:hypothetical protein
MARSPCPSNWGPWSLGVFVPNPCVSHGHSVPIPNRGVPQRKASGLFQGHSRHAASVPQRKARSESSVIEVLEPRSMVSPDVTSPKLLWPACMECGRGRCRIRIQGPKESGWVPRRKGKGVPPRNPVSLSGRVGGLRRKPWCPPTEQAGSRDVSLGVLRRNNLPPTHYVSRTSKKSNTFQQIRQCSIQFTTYSVWFEGTYNMLLQP